MLLAALEKAHRERGGVNPIILHHSSAIHLAFSIFLNGQFVASLLDLLEACVL